MSETTLNCRLLCACNVAALIKPDGSMTPDKIYYPQVEFKKEPVIITGGKHGIDAGYVGTSRDAVILAFRGTLPPAPNLPSILDWLQDLLLLPVSIPGFPKIPGKVHEGFYESVHELWDRVLENVHEQINDSGKPLIVTGHSKGSSMATIASAMLQSEGIAVDQVVTFASPNTGDAKFKKAYTITQTRYTNHLDAVPFLPPTALLASELESYVKGLVTKYPKYKFELEILAGLLGGLASADYTPVGNGIYIKGNSTISHAEHPLEYDVAVLADLDAIKTALDSGQGMEVANAHSIACGSGYMNGICQDPVFCKPT